MAKNILFEEIYDGVLCEAAESFEAEINITNKEEEEGKTVEKSRFVELSEDDLDVIVDRAEAQATKNTTKWGVKLFEGKHKTIKN
jgi:NACalpha-BTF3-like transcription factor